MRTKKLLKSAFLYFLITLSSGCYYIQDNNVSDNIYTQVNKIYYEDNSIEAKKINSGEITYLCSYDDNNLDIDKITLYRELYNGKINVIYTDNNIYEELDTLRKLDESPDIISNNEKAFPYGIYNNYFEKLDDYIDLNADAWTDIISLIDKYKYKDSIYFVPYKYDFGNVLVYNADIFEDYNVPNPYELLKDGNWTWENFLTILNTFKANIPNAKGIIEFSNEDFLASTGETIISFNADEINNNIDNNHIGAALETLDIITENNFISSEKYDFKQARISNDNVFYSLPISEYEKIMRTSNFNMQFVPYPTSELAPMYSIRAIPVGYLVPKGAKNIKGASDWIVLNRLYTINPQNIAIEKKNALSSNSDEDINGYKVISSWSEEMYNLKQELSDADKFMPVFENVKGISMDLDKYIAEKYNEEYADFYNYDKWESNKNALKSAINEVLAQYR